MSGKGQDELVAMGLGSCIGLALVDRAAGVAGLAHIVLPQSSAGEAREIGKYADSAVPEIVSRMLRAGAVEHRLEAVLAGGARMFEVGELDIGARNDAAVRAALTANRVKLRAAATGGDRGRTIRVNPAGTVIVKEAGGDSVTLLEGPAR